MADYTVNHRYSAFCDGVRFGPYEPGTVVQLDPANAEWINRDSPGTLTEVSAGPGERQAPAGPNRQHKGGRNRAGA